MSKPVEDPLATFIRRKLKNFPKVTTIGGAAVIGVTEHELAQQIRAFLADGWQQLAHLEADYAIVISEDGQQFERFRKADGAQGRKYARAASVRGVLGTSAPIIWLPNWGADLALGSRMALADYRKSHAARGGVNIDVPFEEVSWR